MAFKNSDIITLLCKRGQLIGDGKLNEITKIDEKINTIVHE